MENTVNTSIKCIELAIALLGQSTTVTAAIISAAGEFEEFIYTPNKEASIISRLAQRQRERQAEA